MTTPLDKNKMEVKKEMEDMEMARELTEEQRKKYQETKERWQAEHTLIFSTRLQRTTDADIIEKLEAAESRQGELKRLVRLGIAYEQQGGTAPAPAQAPAPVAPAPDKEIQRLARVGAEYEDMLRRGWRMVEPEKKEDEPISKSVQDALSRLQRVMEERRAKEAQQAEQEKKEE